MQIAVSDTMKAAETVLTGTIGQAVAGQVSENVGLAAQGLVTGYASLIGKRLSRVR